MNVILAIDGGGSRTRCLAIAHGGRVLSESETGPSNHLLVNRTVVKQSIENAIEQTLARGEIKHVDVACVSAGLAGVDFDGTGAPEMEVLLGELGFSHTVINGDMLIAHAGALGLRPGVIALAGTGSVILGLGAKGQRVKVGGWGPVYGDEGSAYRIGQMTLRAAARMYDGRGPQTALTERLLRALGLSEFRETISRVYVQAMEPREIAALTRIAYEVAESGDEVARRIFLTAGEELAEGVESAIRQLGLDQQKVLVSYQGAVLESCDLLRARFVEALKQKVPTAEVVAPRFPPVVGAYLLGRGALGAELAPNELDELDRQIVKRATQWSSNQS